MSGFLAVELVPGLKLKNPVMPASGTCEYGGNANVFDPSLLGAIMTKSVALYPKPGNRPPRLAETAGGMLNAVGIPSEGIETFCREKLALLRQYDTALIISVSGETPGDFARTIEFLEKEEGISAYELNLSCPNLNNGIPFGTNPEAMREALGLARKVASRPLIVKLSPNVTSIVDMARISREAGADAVTLINTISGMAIDINKRAPVLGNVFGGLSGPAIKPVALRMVWQVAGSVDIPIIGVGGITNAQDAIEFFMAGASAVQVGTASFGNPLAMLEIIEGIAGFLQKNNFKNLSDIIGLARKNF